MSTLFTINFIKRLIFDWKYLIIQKNLGGRSLVACPNFDHYIYLLPYNRNNVRETTVQPKRHSFGK
jgi:hypothetical protein